MCMKYVLITGGVISGLGKGLVTSSVGVLLKSAGLNVTAIKIDPYLNVDAGTMGPYEHGEVFVLEDGGEVDLDLGNYERFLSLKLTKHNNITGGKIFRDILYKERNGYYLGKTVQFVPHFSESVIEWIEKYSKISTDPESRNSPDVCLIELGGTIGDIESLSFVEALSQLRNKYGNDNFCHLHVSLFPVLEFTGEQKTKPTQQSVKEIRSLGLCPDFLIGRSPIKLKETTINKIASRCYMKPENIISCPNVKNLYEIPKILSEQNLPHLLLSKMNFPTSRKVLSGTYWSSWLNVIESVKSNSESHDFITIAIIAKYSGLKDSYSSLIKALTHTTIHTGISYKLRWICAEESEVNEKLKDIDGIIIPGGFGFRGINGKISAAKYARENKIPFLGICLGLQIAAIEFARNVLDIKNASSAEFNNNSHTHIISPISDHINNQTSDAATIAGSGTMRLGSQDSFKIKKRTTTLQTKLASLYTNDKIQERYRHRYHINPKYLDIFNANKFFTTIGHYNNGELRCDAIELIDHPYYVGVQFHPEFKSTPIKPSPAFIGLFEAIKKRKYKQVY